jgi:DNA-binding HxlR family transcriptional regulator
MAVMDLLGRRWSLRILWELSSGAIGARRLLARCEGMSSSVLYERLRELADAGLVTKNGDGAYQLTDLGADLSRSLQPLDEWSRRWATAVPYSHAEIE